MQMGGYFVATLIVLVGLALGATASCPIMVGSQSYDLNPLRNTAQDYQYYDEGLGKNFKFNFCGPTVTQCNLPRESVCVNSGMFGVPEGIGKFNGVLRLASSESKRCANYLPRATNELQFTTVD